MKGEIFMITLKTESIKKKYQEILKLDKGRHHTFRKFMDDAISGVDKIIELTATLYQQAQTKYNENKKFLKTKDKGLNNQELNNKAFEMLFSTLDIDRFVVQIKGLFPDICTQINQYNAYYKKKLLKTKLDKKKKEFADLLETHVKERKQHHTDIDTIKSSIKRHVK